MTIFGRDNFVSDDGVTLESFGSALVTWRAMLDPEVPLTVAFAAATWNTTPDIVRDAVRLSYWGFLSGADDDPQQIIEIDGD